MNRYLKRMLEIQSNKKLTPAALDKSLSIIAVKAESEGFVDTAKAIDALRDMRKGPKPVPKEAKQRFFDAMDKAVKEQ